MNKREALKLQLPEERRAARRTYMASYYRDHRDEKLAWQKSYRKIHADKITAYWASPNYKAKKAIYDANPLNKAKRFSKRRPDCTSSLETIASIYRTSVSAIDGRPLRIGLTDYVLDHVHDGPAVGLIPAFLNRFLSRARMAEWNSAECEIFFSPAVAAYIRRRNAMRLSDE